MRFLLSLLRWLSAIFFHSALFALIGAICFSSFFGSVDKLKASVEQSGVYDKFVNSVIEANSTKSTAQSSNIPLDDKEVQDIVRQVFTPAVLKENSEKLMNGAYRWLEGSSSELHFSVDFREERESLIDLLSTYAAERLDGLRACTQAELQTANVFLLSCQPPGFYEEIVKNQVSRDLTNSDFLSDATLDESNLPLAKDGKSISEKYDFAPLIFQILKEGVIVFGVIFGLATAIYIALRRPFRKGVKAFGKDMLGNGILLGLFTVFYSFIMPKLTESFNLQAGSGSESLEEVTNYFVHRLDVLIINIAIQIVAVGVVVLIIEKMSRPSSIYSELAKKTGITSSIKSKDGSMQPKEKKTPPVQTSEAVKKSKTSSKKSTKYRKIKM